MASHAAITKQSGASDPGAMSVWSTVVHDQMGLLTAQRDILTRVEQLLIALVQAQLDNGGARTTGSTIMTFARHQDQPGSRAVT